MEVSMPTGSLCAERNVIGTALSADITLRREDIKIVAVYAASMAPPPTTPGASSALYRGFSTSSQTYGAFSKQNSLVLPGGAAEENPGGAGGSEHDIAIIHAMQSPKRSSSISFSDAPQVHPRSGPITPNRSRESTMTSDPTCYPCRDSPGLTPIDTTYPGDAPYPPSQADTPVMGTPSPQHSSAYGGHGNGAKSPQLGAKRKIMSITQLPAASEEGDTVAAVKTARPDTLSVQPSAPPAGLSRSTGLTHQALSAATEAIAETSSSTSNGTSNGTSSNTTATTSSGSRRRTKTKTVAFSASSNNLAAHSPSPVDPSFLYQSDIANCAGSAFLSSPNSSMMDLSATDLAELTATSITVASAVRSIQNHNTIETETITVDKE
jgi:hypothetical protein